MYYAHYINACVSPWGQTFITRNDVIQLNKALHKNVNVKASFLQISKVKK